MRKTNWSPMDQLEFGLRWESIRAAYFQANGDTNKAAQATARLSEIKESWTLFIIHNQQR